MRLGSILLGVTLFAAPGMASEGVEAIQTDFDSPEIMEQLVLQNDSFVDEGGQAYLQLGFVEGEKAGIWVQVPETIEYFKVDFFRVLMGSAGSHHSKCFLSNGCCPVTGRFGS